MPAPRYLPSDGVLAEWAQTMTHQQIADRVYRETGYRVKRSTVSAALSRAGLTNPRRYERFIPWTVAIEHNHHYALVMLRVYARRHLGDELSDEQRKRLSSWLDRMERDQVVVAYAPSTEEGFFYVPREPGDQHYIRKEAIT